MNTQSLRDWAKILDDYRNQRDVLIASRNKVLAVNCGQNTTGMSIAGVAFSITGTNKYYMPEVIAGMETIQAECAKLLTAQIGTLDSKIRGAENTIKKITGFVK